MPTFDELLVPFEGPTVAEKRALAIRLNILESVIRAPEKMLPSYGDWFPLHPTANVVVNEAGGNYDIRIEGDTATNLVKLDAGADKFQIGTTTAGAIADFSSTAIVLNEASADMDFRVESDDSQYMLFVNANDNEVIIDASNALTSADGTLHVHTATAGAIAASADADELVVENSGNAGISILTPDANDAYILFGSPTGTNTEGGIIYNSASDLLDFRIAAATRARFTTAALQFQQASRITTPVNTNLTISNTGTGNIIIDPGVDIHLYSSADLIVYSDAGSTEKARIDGATGNITTAGTVDGIDIAIDVAANTTHRSSDGTDHGYIDQDVTIGSGPAFTSAALTTPAIGVATGTSLTVTGDIQGSGLTGWNLANETWTYASATTFTVPTDLTAKYQKGTKIKLTQTTAKYFYVVASAYGDPNTTVTVTGGTDYSLADAAIASPFFSYAENPQGFPGKFTYTPTWTGGSPSIGNGSLTGTLTLAGVICTATVRLISGTTTDFGTGGVYQWALPITVGTYPIGSGLIYNGTTGACYPGTAVQYAALTAALAASEGGGFTTKDVPITLASPDQVNFLVTYGI